MAESAEAAFTFSAPLQAPLKAALHKAGLNNDTTPESSLPEERAAGPVSRSSPFLTSSDESVDEGGNELSSDDEVAKTEGDQARMEEALRFRIGADGNRVPASDIPLLNTVLGETVSAVISKETPIRDAESRETEVAAAGSKKPWSATVACASGTGLFGLAKIDQVNKTWQDKAAGGKSFFTKMDKKPMFSVNSPAALPSASAHKSIFSFLNDPPRQVLGSSTSLASKPGDSFATLFSAASIDHSKRADSDRCRPSPRVPVFNTMSSSSVRGANESTVHVKSDRNRAKRGQVASVVKEAEESGDESTISFVHLSLINHQPARDELNEIRTTPVFTHAVRKHLKQLAARLGTDEKPFSQYGLLAGNISNKELGQNDPRVFWNIAAPSSFFICGSQGSGKSHTLSVLLENALAPNSANKLPRPLTGIVFHYDTFVSDTGGSPCEAAWLSTNPAISVRVLCPPTNVRTIKTLYNRFPKIRVEELRLSEGQLDTQRMLDLMCVAGTNGMPLYLHVLQRILREMRVKQQQTNKPFSYAQFKQYVELQGLTREQLAPLQQRLDTLESFMVETEAKSYDIFQRRTGDIPRAASQANGTSWSPKNGRLTIVDLSCPCVTAEMACSLFNICLSLFLEQPTTVGRVVALDEAHKYMTSSPECATLTEKLLATIRLQRHLGTRILISTQEPTISPKLLDLCSVTVVHRFTSPDWLNTLKGHLAGVSPASRLFAKMEQSVGKEKEDVGTINFSEGQDPAMELFSRIVGLKVGEALMFAPSAILGVSSEEEAGFKRLAHGVLKVRIRQRTTEDGGRSVMAM